MASFYAELLIEGTTYRVVQCSYVCHQATDARGRVQAKVRHAPLELVLDVPDNDQLLAWAHAPHKPLAGEVVFYDVTQHTAHETIAFTAGECVEYAEQFASGATGNGAYVCLLTITAPSFELRAGGPTLPVAVVPAAIAPAAALAGPAPGMPTVEMVAESMAAAAPKAVSGSQYLPLTQAAHAIYSEQLPGALQTLQDVLGEFGQVQGRAKSPESAANRIQRAVDNGWATKMDTPADVLDNLWDAVGTRVVLKDTSPATMARLTDKLINAINSGQLDVVKIENLYGGDANLPYLSSENTEELLNEAAVRVTQKPYDSGYTATTIFVKYPNGVRGEIQLIGEKTVEIANAEHLVYDAFLGKPYLGSYAPAQQAAVAAEVEPIRAGAQALNPTQKAAYMAYLSGSYADARRAESGLPAQPPAFPAEVPAALSVDNLVATNQKTSKFKVPS
ncbi:MAG: type VI secretion system tube protein TssD [Janthinobacterium lividum]